MKSRQKAKNKTIEMTARVDKLKNDNQNLVTQIDRLQEDLKNLKQMFMEQAGKRLCCSKVLPICYNLFLLVRLNNLI